MSENTSMPSSAYPSKPSNLYDLAFRLTQSDDFSSWNRVINEKRTTFSGPLSERLSTRENSKHSNDDDWIQFNRKGLEVLEPLFAVALVGVESGKDEFSQQEELVHDLVNPPDWKRTGSPILYHFPETAVFVFQALFGAFAVHSKQIDRIFSLANQPLKFPGLEERPLWDSPYAVGWPLSLGKDGHRSCNEAWRFIWDLPDHIPWVLKGLSTDTHFRECLCGHYFLLSFVEFVDCLSKNPEMLDASGIRLAVPTYFSIAPELPAALRIVLSEKEKLLGYAEKNGVDKNTLRRYWAAWVNESRIFLRAVGWEYFFEDEDSYTRFMENLLK